MQIRAIGDRVVVRPEEQPTKVGSLHVPETATVVAGGLRRGRVESVGAGRLMDDGERARPQVEPGEVVTFGPRAGVPVEIGGVHFLILDSDEVMYVG